MLTLVKSTLLNVKHRLIDLFLSSSKKEIYHRILLDQNQYYRGLDIERKRNFIVRTHLFLVTTSFHSEKGFPLTLRMKIVLSSAFVQVTFGLKEDVLEIFNRIVLFAGPYSYRNNPQLFKGDVNAITRSVNMSWSNVSKGFADYNDGINLAIHEFAHCLILENSKRNYLDRILDDRLLTAWKKQAVALLPEVRAGRSGLFRSYGGTNLMEMFAVTLEVLFEKPERFQTLEPEFFKTTSLLLNQDPRYLPNPILP